MPEIKRPLKVFLSYASQDKPVVRELSRRLASDGWIDPWIDEKKLLPGQDWRTKIEEAVETSDVVIICLSSNSVSKEGFVQKELRYAREIAFEKPDETIFLIPLRLDDCTVPRGLRFYQWGDYFGEKEDETYSALLESLKLRYEQKLKIEEENARQEKERQERESAETVAREKAEREAAEKAAREKAEREAAEKAAREKVKREAAEKVEREKAEKAARGKLVQDAVEKAKREKAEREATEKAVREKAKRDVAEKAKREKAKLRAARKAALTKSLSKSFATMKSIFPKTVFLLRTIGIIGIIIVLLWVGSLAVSQFFASTPIAQPSATTTKIPTSTPKGDPFLYDDFKNTIYDGRYDLTLWSKAGDNLLDVYQENGALILATTESTPGGEYVLTMRQPSMRSLDRLQFFEAHLKVDEQKKGFSFVKIQIMAENINGYTWDTECGLGFSGGYGLVCEVIDFYSDGSTSVEYRSSGERTELNTWYTVRIEIDPATATIRYYLDGTQIGTFTPKDSSILISANNFVPRIGVWDGSADDSAMFFL